MKNAHAIATDNLHAQVAVTAARLAQLVADMLDDTRHGAIAPGGQRPNDAARTSETVGLWIEEIEYQAATLRDLIEIYRDTAPNGTNTNEPTT
jgi:hypothetical protein